MGILGRKLGMTSVFTDTGESIPVTLLEAGPCYITDIRTREKNGYYAIQIGYGERSEKKTTKPMKGQFDRANTKHLRVLREFRGKFKQDAKLGDEIKIDIFEVGDRVTISSVSKGKGFAGVVKRHGFRGGPKTHGQSDRLRTPGSIGASASPSRVMKGMRMAGRMGNNRITLRNIKVIRVNPETNLIMVKGAVPGANGALVEIDKVS